MTPERWQQVKELFHAVCERDAAERSIWLEKACAGDEELRQEVESLLAAQEQRGNFLRQPALAASHAPTMEQAPERAKLEAGQMVGHYQVERMLGQGGMGVVYLARDTRLGRSIALKLLQSRFTQDHSRVRRFQQEARAASALNHPGILTIHEVGQTDDEYFIAAEFVDGQTLRARLNGGGLQLSAALELLIQIANALATAHEAGIVHRDIKPENVMVRRDGIVKVLDFGLAKLTEQATRQPDANFDRVTTQPGMVMGTVSYMSPEQARALDVDQRSDLFSLGVVMYELLTGHAPFAGATTSDVLSALLSGEPRPLARYAPELPAALQAIVSRSLAKPVEQRYQTAQAIGNDLKQLKEELEFSARLKGHSASQDPLLTMMVGSAKVPAGATTFSTRTVTVPSTVRFSVWRRYLRGYNVKLLLGLAAFALVIAGAYWGWQWQALRNRAIDSVAVLPFANANSDPQMGYLPDGITESLIGSLSQLPALTVMARSTVFTYKGREVDPRQVGAALKVRAVVTGRVERQGDRLLIHAELVDSATGARLWGERYQRQLADLPIVQEEITREISDALRLRLSGAAQQQLAKRQTANSEAYQLYLRGRELYYQGTRARQEKALDYYQQAIALDPNYALAYTGIAHVYATFSAQYLPPSEAIPKSRQAALKAIQLDETLPEAHFALGLVKVWGDWDWAGAEREFKRSIELNPNFVFGHSSYADLLSQLGRFDEALREIRRVEELDPLSASPSSAIGATLYMARQQDRSVVQFQKTLELHPDNAGAHHYLGIILSQQGRHQEALQELRTALSLDPHMTHRAWLAYGFARAGQRREALKILRELEKALARQERISPVYFARIYTGLGEKDQAFEWLRKGFDEHSDHILGLGVDPAYDPLRPDPRFAELLRGIGLAL